MRHKDPELVVEAISFSGSSQSARSSSTPSPSPATKQPRPRITSGTSTRTSGTSTTPATNPGSLRWDRQTILFSVNAWIFIVAVLATLPLIPKNLSNRAYRLSFMRTLGTSLVSLYSLYGKPRAWNICRLFNYGCSQFMQPKILYTSSTASFALIPVLCQAVEHVAKFLRRNFSQSSLYRWQRNIIQTFMYWQIRAKYPTLLQHPSLDLTIFGIFHYQQQQEGMFHMKTLGKKPNSPSSNNATSNPSLSVKQFVKLI